MKYFKFVLKQKINQPNFLIVPHRTNEGVKYDPLMSDVHNMIKHNYELDTVRLHEPFAHDVNICFDVTYFH